jgi:hypothetical protein
MNDHKKIIYAINSEFFTRTSLLTNLILDSKSNGPNEVWKSVSCNIAKDKIRIVKSRKKTWPPSYSNVMIVKDSLYKIPPELIYKLKESHLLLGPNLDFTLENNFKYLNFFENKKILVPCDWVQTYLIKKLKIPTQSIEVWSSGIDVNYWAPHLDEANNNKKIVIIYVKSTKWTNLVNQYYRLLKDLGFTPVILKYGEYKQHKYKNYLDKSRFLVWFGDTESQSFAQFQAWAMDVPTLILEVNEYINDEISYKASSSPYLTTQTGAFFLQNSSAKETLEMWLDKIYTFAPRNWVLNGHKDSDAIIKLQKIYDNWQS